MVQIHDFDDVTCKLKIVDIVNTDKHGARKKSELSSTHSLVEDTISRMGEHLYHYYGIRK